MLQWGIMTEAPYLSVKEAAAVLDISDDGVRKLIRRKKLRAVKRSERKTLIPRPAFDAYIRKLNGETPAALGRAMPIRGLPERLAAFELEAGKTPHDWLRDWLDQRGSDADEAMAMHLAVTAFGLLSEERSASADLQPAPAEVAVRPGLAW